MADADSLHWSGLGVRDAGHLIAFGAVQEVFPKEMPAFPKEIIRPGQQLSRACRSFRPPGPEPEGQFVDECQFVAVSAAARIEAHRKGGPDALLVVPAAIPSKPLKVGVVALDVRVK